VFLGAFLLLHEAVEQPPAESATKLSLNRALSLVQRAVDEGRATLQGLDSAVEVSVSLEQALAGLQDEFTSGGGVQLRVFVQGKTKALKPGVQEQIYRIGREAVVNALRHSKATIIEAQVEYLRKRLRLGCARQRLRHRCAEGTNGGFALGSSGNA